MKIMAERIDGFISWCGDHLESAIERADADGNGRITRAESKDLGLFKDTYDGFAEKHCTVYNSDFAAAVRSHIRIAARSGELSADLFDDHAAYALSFPCLYKDWEIRRIAANRGFGTLAYLERIAKHAIDIEEVPDGVRQRLVSALHDTISWPEPSTHIGYYAVRGWSSYPGVIAYAGIAQRELEDYYYGKQGAYVLVKPNGEFLEMDEDVDLGFGD